VCVCVCVCVFVLGVQLCNEMKPSHSACEVALVVRSFELICNARIDAINDRPYSVVHCYNFVRFYDFNALFFYGNLTDV